MDMLRLLGKLQSIITTLDMIQREPSPELAEKATQEPGLLDAVDIAHRLTSQIDARIHMIADLVGRL